MINKVLIANRGEIAVRVIRACKEMNIKTVAIYSEVDKDALHVRLADEAVCVGPAKSADSYLNVKNILEAACLTGADSIHPGFGFLAENARFAKMCEECNLKFIGPSYETIELMGNKINSKKLMRENNVPVIEGSKDKLNSYKEAEKLADTIGYPVILKASAGGGGKGIRIVFKKEDLKDMLSLVKQESKNAFGDDTIYMEKYVQNPRHVEIQILSDMYNNCVYLGERDCSVQRNNQKILEESPSTILNNATRKAMGEAAVRAAKAANYEGAGTVEFLVDSENNYYFMEMNTRIQVEHPVTEMMTGIDIVKQQLKIASGKRLDLMQDKIKPRGHSIECRINAENPYKNFMPSPGKITKLVLPGGNETRVDTAVYEGYTIPPYYDSMIAKVIVHARTRNDAISKMKRALDECIIEGIDTNIEFLKSILSNEKFKSGEFTTAIIKEEYDL